MVVVNETARVDLRLQVGAVTEQVTVEAPAPLVETKNATLGVVIDQKKVVDLPLNGRNFTQLGTLIPGVVAPPSGLGGADGNATPGGFGNVTGGFNVNGMRNQSNNFLLDGVAEQRLLQHRLRAAPAAGRDRGVQDPHALLRRRVRPQRRLGRQRRHQVGEQRLARRRVGVQPRRLAAGDQLLRAPPSRR